MKKRVVSTLIAVAAMYFLFLFPQALLDRMHVMVTARHNAWISVTAGAAGNVSLVLVLSFILFASDSAFRGSGKTAKWARSLFASEAARDKFACTPGQASTLWFKYFDTWGIEGSSNRNLLINSYSATYAARAIFYLQRALTLFLVMSAVSILLHWLVLGTYSGTDWVTPFMVHLLVFLSFAAALGFITATNQIPSNGKPSTGCWAKVEDVFGRSRTVFEHEILRHVENLDDALESVDNLRRRLLTPAETH